MTATLLRVRLTVTGVVEGVGFRPHVHRLAVALGLSGFVGNDTSGVFVEAQGAPDTLAEFEHRLVAEAPPMAVITSVRRDDVSPVVEKGFSIVSSVAAVGPRTLVSPDAATCDNCLAELFDPSDRRYLHPFITCTDCGPRFTIITDVPYDRPVTTMAGFPMCAACAAEYADPSDRRFHAQPIACHDCGPVLTFGTDTGDAAIQAARAALAGGAIVAIKGIGGYHLACRADDPEAIAELRRRKARDAKPFAVMARDLSVVRRLVEMDDDEQMALTGRARPIVLMRRLAGAPVAPNVAPGNPLLGVMLPYTPVHHLLLAEGPDVLVMTSANISDEPLVYEDADRDRLERLADAVLAHDRPIHVPCDDSVVRIVDGRELPIRRSRGYAPLPVALGRGLPAVLAVGGELKNTTCLVDGANAFVSAHVGDMGNLETLRAFERVVGQLTTLHQRRPVALAADAHPGYQTHGWAERQDLPVEFVQHHHAHVVSLLAEHGKLGEPVIGVAFDGTGYGSDAAVWGGEILLVGSDVSSFDRVGHLLPVPMAGGDSAVRHPARMAVSYLRAAGLPAGPEYAFVERQLDSGHSVRCTSAGRLFDAVAALLNVRDSIEFEGQAAIELEILAASARPSGPNPLHLPVVDGVIDHRPLIRDLVASDDSPGDLARWFHEALADAIATACAAVAGRTGVRTAGLTGGVFQNALLTTLTRARLQARGLEVLTHRLVPPNDGGLALGQAVVAAWKGQ